MATLPYKRIIVVGATGSGKSTTAERLAQRLGSCHIELDALYWQPNWVGTPDEEFLAKVDAATQAESWTLSGNYRRTRPITWQRADAVIWLDYPLPIVFWQLLKRTIRRAVKREVLWGTNVENFWKHLELWSDDSLFKWLFKTYWRRKREYPLLFAQLEYAHLKVFHFKSPKEMETWFNSL